MRPERRAAIPGDQRAMLTSERQPEQTSIGNRQRLDPYALGMLGIGERVARRADQGGAKREHSVAVARRSLTEEDDRIALGQPLRDLRVDLLGLVAATAIDKHRSLQLCEQSKYWPRRHLAFGNKDHRSKRGNHRNIQPRNMIGHDQQRMFLHSLAYNDNANPE